MNAVEVSVEGIGTPDWIERARDFSLTVLGELGKDDWDLSILLCDDGFITGLNGEYRDRHEPTDVLSFEQGETYRDAEGGLRFLAGDIVISLDSLARNADESSVPREEELARLLVHGILHLSGMDHEGEGPESPMLVLQEEILRRLLGRGGEARP